MRRFVYLILGLCLISSCKRYPDPSIRTLESYYFSFTNKAGQKYFAGESVQDTVKYKTINNQTGSGQDSLKVIFDAIKGDGLVSNEITYTNKKGIASTRWQLGMSSCEQTLRASVYNLSGRFLTSTDFTAYGFRTDTWDAFTGSPDGNITGLVADTVYGITLMVSNGKIYRQGNRYYGWEEIVDPDLVSPRTIGIDRKGVIYVSTWKGEIVKSTDHGESWSYCTKPYSGNPYFIYMYVSNDNYIWVAKSNHPTIFSRDGGETWNVAGSALNSTYLGDMFRLKNGSLMFSSSACCFILRSVDDGATWTRIEIPGHANKLYVNEKDELFVVGQDNGCTIYKSSDMGENFESLYSVPVSFRSSMDHVFNKWNNFYYVAIQGYGILKSSDLIHYEKYWENRNLDNLFIDHNGVLIAKQYNSTTVYYRKNSL